MSMNARLRRPVLAMERMLTYGTAIRQMIRVEHDDRAHREVVRGGDPNLDICTGKQGCQFIFMKVERAAGGEIPALDHRSCGDAMC